MWRKVAGLLRPRWPKPAALMNGSGHDVLACMSFPRQHRTKLDSISPTERLNKEVKRRADVAGIFRTGHRSSASLTLCSLSRTTNGRPPADTCRPKPSLKPIRRKQTRFSASQLKPPDHDPRPTNLHHIDGRDLQSREDQNTEPVLQLVPIGRDGMLRHAGHLAKQQVR